jgi:hypothetical protein
MRCKKDVATTGLAIKRLVSEDPLLLRKYGEADNP